MFLRLNRQISEETEEALQPEWVHSFIVFVKEFLIIRFSKLGREISYGLRVKLIRVEVEWQNGLNERTVEPEGRLFLEDYLKYSGQDLRLVWIVDESAISLMIRN